MLNTKYRESLKKYLSPVAAFLFVAVLAGASRAGHPVIWEISGRADLLKGDARGISISDTGMLMLAP
jgi:hypothetical protein